MKSLIIKFVLILTSLLAFVWLIIQLIHWIFEWSIFRESGYLGALVIVLACLFGALSYVFYYYYQSTQPVLTSKLLQEENEDDNQLTEALILDLSNAFDEERWEEVIKIGSVLSRPLWLTGKYNLQVKIGKLIEAAASFSNHPEYQAAALIDDLGWTMFILGEKSEAEGNIKHGIKVAKECGEIFLVYKGYRHLSGIYLEANNLEQAKYYHNMSVDYANLIEDEQKQTEAKAGIHVNEAILLMKEKKWEKAIENIKVAQEIYNSLGDADRVTKLYHFYGDALYKSGHIDASKDIYRKGLSESKRLSRKDGILRNYLGLGRIARLEGNRKEEKTYFTKARKYAEELCREDLLCEFEEESLVGNKLI